MASKQRKEALVALDRANKEYEEVCKALKDKYAELDKESDSAIELISDVETLVESIRRRPWSYKAVKMKIAVCKRKFIDSKELKRKERNNNITADIVAGGVAVGGVTLIAFYKEMFKKNIILRHIPIQGIEVLIHHRHRLSKPPASFSHPAGSCSETANTQPWPGVP